MTGHGHTTAEGGVEAGRQAGDCGVDVLRVDESLQRVVTAERRRDCVLDVEQSLLVRVVRVDQIGKILQLIADQREVEGEERVGDERGDLVDVLTDPCFEEQKVDGRLGEGIDDVLFVAVERGGRGRSEVRPLDVDGRQPFRLGSCLEVERQCGARDETGATQRRLLDARQPSTEADGVAVEEEGFVGVGAVLRQGDRGSEVETRRFDQLRRAAVVDVAVVVVVGRIAGVARGALFGVAIRLGGRRRPGWAPIVSDGVLIGVDAVAIGTGLGVAVGRRRVGTAVVHNAVAVIVGAVGAVCARLRVRLRLAPIIGVAVVVLVG